MYVENLQITSLQLYEWMAASSSIKSVSYGPASFVSETCHFRTGEDCLNVKRAEGAKNVRICS